MSSIRVGVAQVPQTSELEKNLEKALTYIEQAADQGVELLCFPETHLTGYRTSVLSTDGLCDELGLKRATEKISATCREKSMGIILGSETPNPDGKPFNSALIIDEQGETIALHHKSKLTPNDAMGYFQGHSDGDRHLF